MLKYCENSLSQPLFAPSNSRSISHSALGDRIGCASAAASADPTEAATALGSGTGASSKRLKHGEESGILSSSKMDLMNQYFFYI